jgi:hypothetical protein
VFSWGNLSCAECAFDNEEVGLVRPELPQPSNAMGPASPGHRHRLNEGRARGAVVVFHALLIAKLLA